MFLSRSFWALLCVQYILTLTSFPGIKTDLVLHELVYFTLTVCLTSWHIVLKPPTFWHWSHKEASWRRTMTFLQKVNLLKSYFHYFIIVHFNIKTKKLSIPPCVLSKLNELYSLILPRWALYKPKNNSCEKYI